MKHIGIFVHEKSVITHADLQKKTSLPQWQRGLFSEQTEMNQFIMVEYKSIILKTDHSCEIMII
jgi:hypothetical protein